MELKIHEEDVKSKKKMVAFEINQEWYDILKKVADEEMISLSTLIRKIIYKNCIEEQKARFSDRKE